jgi:hypothetical protein
MQNSLKLIDLFYSSKNRSIKWKKYFSVYEKLFEIYRNKEITFVEIGILDGGSLEIWKKYFGKNSRIIGIDNNPECKKFENQDYEIFIGSQSDPKFWHKFYKQVGDVDIVLDDGGHTNDQQIVSLIESIKNIKDGGLHVVEDVHTSYQKHYGNPYKYSFMNFSKKTIDDINTTFPNTINFNYTLNKSIYSVEFFESIIAFKVDKRLCDQNLLIENKGYKSNNSDVTLGNNILNFRKKFVFLYKFRLMHKLERIFIKYLYRNKSKKLNKFFN